MQEANIHQLHPILHDLVNTTFFRLFRVNLKNPTCPFWQPPASEREKEPEGGASGTCTGSVPTLGGTLGGGAGLPFSSAMSSSASSPIREPEDVPCGIDAEEAEEDEESSRSASARDEEDSPME